MTRGEAIERLEYIAREDDSHITTADIEAIEMAIAALKAEPCGDAVKREAVLNTLDAMDAALDEDRTVEHYKELLAECYKALPPITPKQRTGHWIMTSYYLTTAYGSIDYVKCSCCGEDSLEEGDYCPNCGAKMEGENE